MSDYIPDKDLEFDSFQLNFINYVNSNFTALGLDAGDLLPIQAGNAVRIAAIQIKSGQGRRSLAAD